MSDWRDKEIRNETIFRELNEWTADSSNSRRVGRESTDETYLCECSDSSCTDPIKLTHVEYQAIRAVSVRFAIAVNHENPELDLVVAENPRFATVEKVGADGREIARATDPRR